MVAISTLDAFYLALVPGEAEEGSRRANFVGSLSWHRLFIAVQISRDALYITSAVAIAIIGQSLLHCTAVPVGVTLGAVAVPLTLACLCGYWLYRNVSKVAARLRLGVPHLVSE